LIEKNETFVKRRQTTADKPNISIVQVKSLDGIPKLGSETATFLTERTC